MNRHKLETGEIYHIYNRGVEKRNVFMEKTDYSRFTGNLAEFNDIRPALEVGLPNVFDFDKEPLVEILVFVQMPNHFHLLLKQLIDNGITMFMRKLGTGYTNYFNQKYKRVGPLFQGKYKSVLLKEEKHFLYIPFYLHSNPLDIIIPNWKENGIKDYSKAIDFLKNYKWSSFIDYIGGTNFPLVTTRNFILELIGGKKLYLKNFEEWLKENRYNMDMMSKLL